MCEGNEGVCVCVRGMRGGCVCEGDEGCVCVRGMRGRVCV